MRKILLALLLLAPLCALGQTFAGNAGSDIFIAPPFRECFGGDDGKSTCFIKVANNEVRTNGAVDFQLANRTISSLPSPTAAVNVGRLYLITDGISSTDCSVGFGTNRVFCASDGTAWVALTGTSSGGGTGIGPLTNGCIPVAAPSGLVCSGLTDNTVVIKTSEQIQGTSVVATAPNGGADFTGGDGSGINFQPGHAYLYSDAAFNFGLHEIIGTQDTNATILTNPVGTTYHIDGFVNTSLCGLVQGLPAHTIATVYEDILETNIPCDPFNQGQTIHLILGVQSGQYTFNVPLRIGPNEWLKGSGRGFSGQTTKGTSIAPGASYATSNPFISATPSGFTIAASTTGCNFIPPIGSYLVEVSWGPDTTRETLPGPETSVSLDGATQCVRVTPPGSPATGVTTYDVYMVQVAGNPSGTELWQAQAAIGNSVSVPTGGAFPTGNGRPVGYNNTGTFVVVGNANGPQGNAGSTQATFGARLEDLSIDCANVTGCVAAAILTGEEGAGIFRVDANNVPGVAEFIWEGYGNIGEAGDNSRMVDLTMNAGSTSNPSISGMIFDQLTSVRGLDGFTATVPTTGGASSCILVNGTTVAPIGGTSISNGHMEKCGDGILLQNSAGAFISNMSCSPSNIAHCIHNATTGGNFVAVAIRGGNSDAPVFDETFTPAFTDSKGFEPFYSNFGTSYTAQTLGTLPTVTMTGLGTGGTPGCVIATGGNSFGGIINCTTGTTALTAAALGTISLIFPPPGFGVNNPVCTYKLQNVPGCTTTGCWNPRATIIGSQAGTGHDDNLWDNNGVALLNTHSYSIEYQCTSN